jgi:predicted nucleotidyltransferase
VSELIDLAAEIQEFCLSRGWKFCFIGGLVVQEWSEPRATEDVDLTLLTGFGGEEAYIEEWLLHYQGRVPDARGFALMNRVLLLKSKAGLGIDIALAAIPSEKECIARARDVEAFPGVKLRFCSPEDLIVMKAFANRVLDWKDVQMTIVRQGDKLDWKYIRKQLKPLLALKEEPEILTKLERIRKKYSGRRSEANE